MSNSINITHIVLRLGHICHTQLLTVSWYSLHKYPHVKMTYFCNFHLFWSVFVPSPGGQICISIFYHQSYCNCWLSPIFGLQPNSNLELMRFWQPCHPEAHFTNDFSFAIQTHLNWMLCSNGQFQAIDHCINSELAMTAKHNLSPPGQNSCHFTKDIFRCVFMNEKFCSFIKISLKFVPKCLIHNNP